MAFPDPSLYGGILPQMGEQARERESSLEIPLALQHQVQSSVALTRSQRDEEAVAGERGESGVIHPSDDCAAAVALVTPPTFSPAPPLTATGNGSPVGLFRQYGATTARVPLLSTDRSAALTEDGNAPAYGVFARDDGRGGYNGPQGPTSFTSDTDVSYPTLPFGLSDEGIHAPGGGRGQPNDLQPSDHLNHNAAAFPPTAQMDPILDGAGTGAGIHQTLTDLLAAFSFRLDRLEHNLTNRFAVIRGGVQTCQDNIGAHRGCLLHVDRRLDFLEQALQNQVNIQAAATATSTYLHDNAATLLQSSRDAEAELVRQHDVLLHRIVMLENSVTGLNNHSSSHSLAQLLGNRTISPATKTTTTTRATAPPTGVFPANKNPNTNTSTPFLHNLIKTEEHARKEDDQVLRDTQLDIAARVQVLETRLINHDMRVRHELLSNKITRFVAERSRRRDAEALWHCMQSVVAGDVAALDHALAKKAEAGKREKGVAPWCDRLLFRAAPGRYSAQGYAAVRGAFFHMREGGEEELPEGFKDYWLDAWGCGVLEKCLGWIDEYVGVVEELVRLRDGVAAPDAGETTDASAGGGEGAGERSRKVDAAVGDAGGVLDLGEHEDLSSEVDGEETASEYHPDTDMEEWVAG
ncbi:hypothetical protein LTS18_005869 [Coniosporium uncinatum]|uniref:Uncharacterized protein n=1 Tax=Coniosporium uncinatum TaxID=93489 RepID=A0ACC3D448_9PEZI|nr:hypothetical protein LTS18_005869 [Coniosporium uncinatum]